MVSAAGQQHCDWLSVAIEDNLLRRDIEEELSAPSLSPIESLENRIAFWNEHSQNTIGLQRIDLQDFESLLAWVKQYQPEVIVHMAEQRSAPYSMMNSESRRFTIQNNIVGTHNLLSAIVDAKIDCRIVHMGTMGIYGYSSSEIIPEGYIERADGTKVLYPYDPGSIYHMSKALDHQMFQFYNKNWKVQITDLHQGIVWGTQTAETLSHPALVNRIDYDGEFGTVLNRFLIQAAADEPLSVYGSGGQKRAFVHIEDAISCICWAVENSLTSFADKVRVFNLFTEILKVEDLAQSVREISQARPQHLENPRIESENNQLQSVSTITKIIENPKKVTSLQLSEELSIMKTYIKHLHREALSSRAKWQ